MHYKLCHIVSIIIFLVFVHHSTSFMTVRYMKPLIASSTIPKSTIPPPIHHRATTPRGDTTKYAAAYEDAESKPLDTSRNDRKPTLSESNWTIVAISCANLVKNCVGSGVFSLNSRVSAISADPWTLLPASLVTITMAAWAAYNFYMVGETCRLTNSTTYGEAWRKSISPSSEWLIQMVTVVAPIISSLANVIVLTDILAFTLRYFGAPDVIWGNRNLVIGLLSCLVLFPISISKDLSGLRAISVFGIIGHLLAVATLGIRILDRSYLPGGKYYSKIISTIPAAASAYSPSKYFVLMSLLSYCFVTHYNAPRYYKEVTDRDPNPKSFAMFAGLSYTISSLIYILTMIFGVTLFGSQSSSFALNSFSHRDPLANVARLAFGTSVLASFPLIFLSVRTWLLSQVKQVFPSIKDGIRPITFLALTGIAFLATKFTDIGVVGSLSGGILGSSMMFIFPPIMYTGALIRQAKIDGKNTSKKKIFVNGMLTVAGAALGFFGTALTIQSILRK